MDPSPTYRSQQLRWPFQFQSWTMECKTNYCWFFLYSNFTLTPIYCTILSCRIQLNRALTRFLVGAPEFVQETCWQGSNCLSSFTIWLSATGKNSLKPTMPNFSVNCKRKILLIKATRTYANDACVTWRWKLLNPDSKINYLPHPMPADGAKMEFQMNQPLSEANLGS